MKKVPFIPFSPQSAIFGGCSHGKSLQPDRGEVLVEEKEEQEVGGGRGRAGGGLSAPTCFLTSGATEFLKPVQLTDRLFHRGKGI